MRRFIEIMWLAIAAFSTVEMIAAFRDGGIKNQNVFIFAILLLASLFMYFFRKRQRKNMENRKNSS